MLQTVTLLKPPAPAPRMRPLGPIGLLRVLATNPLEAWTEAHFEEPIVAGGLPFGRAVVVSDPAAIRRVLLDNPRNYEKDWMQRRILSAGLADGLLSAEGHQWRVQRRALAPLFSRRSVMNFSGAVVAEAEALVERLHRKAGETVDVAAEVTLLTLAVLERTIFSDGVGADREEVRLAMQRYFEVASRIDPFDILGLPAAIPRLRRLNVWSTLRFFEKTIDRLIETRRRRLAASPDDVPQDLLTLLLHATDPQTGARLSEAEVRANVLTFIAAGHETTANCLTWSLYLLSQSREWRERLCAEAERELDRGDPASLADRLVETRAVIDESNRLYPPISAISRVARGDDELSGHAVRRGTMVVIAPYVLHRHRALWTQADAFSPERFLPGARETIERFAYLPFGAGPRVCIGSAFALQEACVTLAMLARDFDFALAPGHVVRPVQKMTLRADGGMRMILTRRD
ncbi:MAG TPA: cytochrome P450 [Pseudolabrys sp.]|nr:cytochrome P450 [Pseudolabrys sp.]